MYYETFDLLCKARNVNQRTVSLATGIATATLSNWKNGNYTPKIDKLQKIADYFDVTVEYLMTGKESDSENKVSTLPYDPEQVAEAMKIYSQYQNASPEIQKAIELLLKSSQSES